MHSGECACKIVFMEFRVKASSKRRRLYAYGLNSETGSMSPSFHMQFRNTKKRVKLTELTM